jgi:hypothetical protein
MSSKVSLSGRGFPFATAAGIVAVSAFLIVSLCAVAPVAAMPAALSSPNVASSILLEVAESSARRSGRGEVRQNGLSGERSAAAARALRQEWWSSPYLVPNHSQAAFWGARSQGAFGGASTRPELTKPLKRPNPNLGLMHSYGKDAGTYNDTPRHPLPEEPAPPTIVYGGNETYDVTPYREPNGTDSRKNEPERRCIPRDHPIPGNFCSN